jgi:tether containing UBX domain for GLUT4
METTDDLLAPGMPAVEVGVEPRSEPAAEPPSKPEMPLRPRDLRVFRPTDVAFDPRRLQLPEDFYAPTQSDVKASLASLSGTTSAMNNAPLMTKKMRDAEQAKKMSRFRKVLIRVRLPDRTSIQGTFVPQSRVRDVIKFVNDVLRDPKAVKFHLFVVPPKQILNDLDATLWSQGLVPAALVNIGIDTGPSEASLLLSDTVLSYLEDAPPPGSAVFSITAPPVAAESTKGSSSTGSSSKSPSDVAASVAKKIPKWMQKKK